MTVTADISEYQQELFAQLIVLIDEYESMRRFANFLARLQLRMEERQRRQAVRREPDPSAPTIPPPPTNVPNPQVIVPDNVMGPLEVGIYHESEVAFTNCGAIPPAPERADLHSNMREAASHINPFWFRRQVRGGTGPWDYKLQSDRYEGFGNFNYGATGASFGFPFTIFNILQREPGRAQIDSGTSRPDWGNPGSRFNPWGGIAPYGDSPVDQEWIRRGIEYAHCQVPW